MLYFHKSFIKKLEKLPTKIVKQARLRIELFQENEFHPTLNNHLLKGKYKGCRSLNITGDYRIIFQEKDGEIIFIEIGTHSELYK